MPRTSLGLIHLNNIYYKELSPCIRGKIIRVKDIGIIES